MGELLLELVVLVYELQDPLSRRGAPLPRGQSPEGRHEVGDSEPPRGSRPPPRPVPPRPVLPRSKPIVPLAKLAQEGRQRVHLAAYRQRRHASKLQLVLSLSLSLSRTPETSRTGRGGLFLSLPRPTHRGGWVGVSCVCVCVPRPRPVVSRRRRGAQDSHPRGPSIAILATLTRCCCLLLRGGIPFLLRKVGKHFLARIWIWIGSAKKPVKTAPGGP